MPGKSLVVFILVPPVSFLVHRAGHKLGFTSAEAGGDKCIDSTLLAKVSAFHRGETLAKPLDAAGCGMDEVFPRRRNKDDPPAAAGGSDYPSVARRDSGVAQCSRLRSQANTGLV